LAVYPRFHIPDVTSDKDFLEAYAKTWKVDQVNWLNAEWGNEQWELFIENHFRVLERYLEQDETRWELHQVLSKAFGRKVSLCFMALYARAKVREMDIEDVLFRTSKRWLWHAAYQCRLRHESGFLKGSKFFVRFHRYYVFHFLGFAPGWFYRQRHVYWYEVLRSAAVFWHKFWFGEERWRGWDPDWWLLDDVPCPVWQREWAKVLQNAWYHAPGQAEKEEIVRPVAKEIVLAQGGEKPDGHAPIVWYRGETYPSGIEEKIAQLQSLTKVWKEKKIEHDENKGTQDLEAGGTRETVDV